MIDPRPSVIEGRLARMGRILAISGGKGGIGKSSVACMLALCLSQKGYRTGLFDLDFQGPSDHVLLGVSGVRPEEQDGIVPPRVHGINFMSLTYFTGDYPAPFRGPDTSNALLEFLAITHWKDLDFLVIDMPPGLGDTILDAIRLIKRMEFLVITTRSRLALDVVRKELAMLKDRNAPILGVIENMKRPSDSEARHEIAATGVPFLGAIDFDPDFERAVGDADRLRTTGFMRQLEPIVDGLVKPAPSVPGPEVQEGLSGNERRHKETQTK
jgi:ATP-binding protein involved in chromosome partitioning